MPPEGLPGSGVLKDAQQNPVWVTQRYCNHRADSQIITYYVVLLSWEMTGAAKSQRFRRTVLNLWALLCFYLSSVTFEPGYALDELLTAGRKRQPEGIFPHLRRG